jgi:hypothetical protein
MASLEPVLLDRALDFLTCTDDTPRDRHNRDPTEALVELRTAHSQAVTIAPLVTNSPCGTE